MTGNKSTVLVVEDDRYILKVLETLLSSGGYKVVSAASGADARTLFSSHMPQMILLD